MLAAIHPLLALAAVHPTAAVVAASNLMDFFNPAQNPAAALMAFQMGWEAACRHQQGLIGGGCDPGGLLTLALLGRGPAGSTFPLSTPATLSMPWASGWMPW